LFTYNGATWDQEVFVLSDDNSMINGLSFCKMEK